ncbi:hypothetical protein [Aureimonas psammosilenae]|uniref:hypothetical protein n=1 Tax=Aureimonas psammosilenae TaxID=2495496 RepID=UPI001260D038|nr:hypothetical protein [Aureimonas psammosilenae]
MQGLSNRAYAKRQDCTERAVRKARDEGRLNGAIFLDGSIDADKADALLAKSATSGERVPSDLTEARRRKLAAQCALLHDEVETMRGGVVLPNDAKRIMTESCVITARRLFRIPSEIAARVAGKPVAEASAIIQEAAYQALSDLSKTPPKAPPKSAPKRSRQSFDDMDATALAAMKATYQTLKIHVQQDRKKGVVLDIAEISASMTKRFSAVRTKTLALHVKAAPYVAIATAAKAEEILRKEITDVVRDLADGKMVPIGALMAVEHADEHGSQ